MTAFNLDERCTTGIIACEDVEEFFTGDTCDCLSLTSISSGEMQCMNCLRILPKYESFKSDWPNSDRS